MNRSILSLTVISLVSLQLFALSERDVQNAARDKQTAEFAVTGALDALNAQKKKVCDLDVTKVSADQFKKELQNLQTQFDFYNTQKLTLKAKTEVEASLKMQWEALQKLQAVTREIKK